MKWVGIEWILYIVECCGLDRSPSLNARFQASAVVHVQSSLFLFVAQNMLVVVTTICSVTIQKSEDLT